ncbi:IRK-interacting protein [Quillaja saponaria]|uniref:IRK-interacting protein n=1 Tax=Quillaja saponaria TaxID=32244 RepID=A0AAD7PM21_QUISA|nr:IRK-interacting protein [Quillaja saponaria]
MTKKVLNFSDLIQRVTASCLLHPLADGRYRSTEATWEKDSEEEYRYESETNEDAEEEEEEEEEEDGGEENVVRCEALVKRQKKEMEALMEQVFEAVSAMKRAYVNLQQAHCPWDPEKMRAADATVVAEMRKLGVLKERFRRKSKDDDNGGSYRWRSGNVGAATIRDVVAPYEAVVEDLKREVKARDLEVQNLKGKLQSSVSLTNDGGKKVGRSRSKRRISCSQIPVAAPAPALFEVTMVQVKEASKSFASLLLSLMHSAHWDIDAAVRSIEAAIATTNKCNASSATVTTNHAKYAIESYISCKIFQGFGHETFYMDGSLSSLLNPDQFHHNCYTQYHDLKAMDPVELLGISPTCQFGKFCSNKYLAIIHPKMEESLFGNLEQHQQVLAGKHPRSQFYSEFLRLAKAVWLLHLLAFSLDPAPSQFEASQGAEFHQQYMESVVKFSGGQMPGGQIVGFPVSPGFNLGKASVIKARVYLIPRT